MSSRNIRAILAIICTVLLLGASAGTTIATTSTNTEKMSSEETIATELAAEFPANVQETTEQNESGTQQDDALEQAARQGVADGIAYLEQAGTTISEEHRQAALEGAVAAATDLEQRGINTTQIDSLVISQSAYGATVGALSNIQQDSVIAVPDAQPTVLSPNTTSSIVFGAVFGTSLAAVRTKTNPSNPTPTAVIEAAWGAAFGSSRTILGNPSVENLAGPATAGAAAGALRGARTIGGVFVDSQGTQTIVDPQPYVGQSALGAAAGTLAGASQRQQAGQSPNQTQQSPSPSSYEVVVTASAAATDAIVQATQNDWPPEQAYYHAYTTGSQSMVEGRYADSQE